MYFHVVQENPSIRVSSRSIELVDRRPDNSVDAVFFQRVELLDFLIRHSGQTVARKVRIGAYRFAVRVLSRLMSRAANVAETLDIGAAEAANRHFSIQNLVPYRDHQLASISQVQDSHLDCRCRVP